MAKKKNVSFGNIKKGNISGLNWVTNATKSLGYSSTDLIKALMPATADMVEANTEIGVDLYSDLRNLKVTTKKISSSLMKNDTINIAHEAMQNAMSDLKSGKLYNKERVDALINSADDDFGMEDFNFDDDFSSDSFDDDNDNFDSDESQPSKTVNNIKIESGSNVSYDPTLYSTIDRGTVSTIKSIEGVSKVNVSLAGQKMGFDRIYHSELVGGLNTINENLSLLVNYHSENTTKYMAAGLAYYDESMTIFRESLDLMKTSSGTANTIEDVGSDDVSIEKMFLSKGGLNLKEYTNVMKKNFGNLVDSDMFLSSIKYMMEDTDTLKYLAANPLSFISTKIMTTLVPSFMRKNAEALDKSIGSFFPAMIAKINRLQGSDNPIADFFGKLLGIDSAPSTTVDLSTYKKDAIPFDGYTKKAITEVIPTYLRKILAALTGSEDEKAFDYDKGTFRSVKEMLKEDKDNRDNTALSSFNKPMDEIKRRAEAFQFESSKDKDDFNKDLKGMFIALSNSNKLIKPDVYKDKDGRKVDELGELYDFSQRSHKEIIRQIILSMPNHMQTEMFGKSMFKSHKDMRTLIDDMEKDSLKYNTGVVNDSMAPEFSTDEQSLAKRKFRGVGRGVDEFGHDTLDYLRDIKRILLKGINVFPNTPLYSNKRKKGQSRANNQNIYQSDLDLMEDENTRFIRDHIDASNDVSFTDEQRREMEERGQVPVTSVYDLNRMSSDEIKDKISTYVSTSMSDTNTKSYEGWIDNFISADIKDKYNMMRIKIDDIMTKPAELLNGVFQKIDNTLYNLVFGGNDMEKSFISKTMDAFKTKFDALLLWGKEKVFMPIHEALLGKEGVITKLKDSEFFRSGKEKFKTLTDFVFGKADGDGKRNGGLFSDTANEVLDIGDSIKYYFTGKGYTNRAGISFADDNGSVFGEIKGIFSSFKSNIKTYLFGDEEKGEEKGVLKGITDSLATGFNNFSSALFGPRKDGKQYNASFGELTDKIKSRMPRSLAYGILGAGASILSFGKVGLLGSLFLPGGPIGAAIAGTTIGLVSQSDRFKDFIFGEKDYNNERVGGIVNKSTQEFFKKNKAGIIGGATLGGLKSVLGFGLLPSFFLPGGIVGGAIAGMAASMLFRSETLQRTLFGEKDENGKRAGGFLSKIFTDEMKKKNLLGNIGAGAISGAGIGLAMSKFGLIGSMLVPGGPLGGAILGSIAGIALSSDKWKKVLFGEFDEDSGLRKGGLIGKTINWLKLEVQEPLKLKLSEINLNIQEWFTKSIANPFLKALSPIRAEFKYMTDSMKQMFEKGWESFKGFLGDTFENFVGKPFGEFMDKNIMSPLKKFFNGIINSAGKIIGSVLSAPFSAVGYMAEGLTKKQAQRGLESHVKESWEDIKDSKGRKERGEKQGLFSTKDSEGNKVGKGFLGKIYDAHFNKNARDDARYGPQGASYYRAEQEKWKNTEEEQNKAFAEKRAKLEAQRDKLNLMRSVGKKADYDNFTGENGNVRVDHVYNAEPLREPVSSFNQSKMQQTAASYEKGEPIVSPSDIINNKKVDPMTVQKYKDRHDRRHNKNKKATVQDDNTDIAIETPQIANQSSGRKAGFNINPQLFTSKETEKEDIKPPTNVEVTSSGPSIIPTRQTSTSEERLGSKSKNSLLAQIANDVRVIASEVKGQLDGLGGNVFKIRKLVQKQNNVSDEDLSGSSNRDRVGLLGKVRRMMFAPFDAIKDKMFQITAAIGEKIGAVKEFVVSAAKTLVSIPVEIIKGVGKFAGEVGNIVKEGLLSVAKLPVAIAEMGAELVKVGVESLKIIGPGIAEVIKGFGSMFKGAADMMGGVLSGVCFAAKETFKTIALESGKMIGAFTDILYTGITTATKTAFGLIGALGKGVIETTKIAITTSLSAVEKVSIGAIDTVSAIGKSLLDVGKTFVDFTLSPFKWLGEKISGKKEVFISGGILDNIKNVENIGGRFIEQPKNDLPIPISEDKIQTIQDVRIVGITPSTTLPVSLQTNKTSNNAPKLSATPAGFDINPQLFSSTNKDNKIKPPVPESTDNGLTSSLITAMDVFDDKNDKEEDTKKAKAQTEAEVDSDNADAKKKNASFVKNAKDMLAEKIFNKNNMLTQVDLLKDLVKTTKNHAAEWAGMFGKKGLIALAVMAALPILGKLYKWIKARWGGGDNPGPGGQYIGDGGSFIYGLENADERTDVDENGNPVPIYNDPGRESLGKSIIKGTKKGARYVIKNWDKIKDGDSGKFITKSATFIKEKGGKAVKAINNVLDKGVAKIVKPFVNEVPDVVKQSLVNTPKSQSQATVKVSTSIADSMAKNAEKISSSLRKSIVAFFESSTVKNAINGASKGGADKVAAKVIAIFDKFITPGFITKNLGRLSKAALKDGAKAGAGVLSAGTSYAAFAVWDGISGAHDAANIFEVDKDTVDGKMRLAAAISKALVEFSAIIGIAAAILHEQRDIGIKQIVATELYNLFSLYDEEAMASLDKSKATFKLETQEYNKQKGTHLSVNAYNDKVNKTLGHKILHPIETIKDMGKGIKEDFKNLKSTFSGSDKALTGSPRNDERITLKPKEDAGKTRLEDNYRARRLLKLDGKDVNIDGKMRFAAKAGDKISSMTGWDSYKTTATIHGMITSTDDYFKNLAANTKISFDQGKKRLEATRKDASEKLKGIGEHMKGNIDDAKNFFKDIGTKFKNMKGESKREIDGNISAIGLENINLTKEAKEKWKKLGQFIKDDLGKASDTISKSTRDIKKFATDVWGKLPNSVKSPLEEASTAIKKTAKNLGSTVSNIFNNIGKSIDDAIGGTEILNSTKKALSSFIDKFIKNMIPNLIDHFTNKSESNVNKNTVLKKNSGGRGDFEEEGGFGVEPDRLNNFAYYSQYDDRWATTPYDHSSKYGKSSNPTIKARGCGPTSMSMVLTQLTGKRYEPPQLAKIAQDAGYSTSQGTSWGYYDYIAKNFSLNKTNVDVKSKSNIMSRLSAGEPIILSGKKGFFSGDSPFTSGGHFVVATKSDGNKVTINDPRGPKYSKDYDLDKVMKEARGGWSFKYNGGPLPEPNNATPFTANAATSLEDPPEKLTIVDLFGKMSENMSLLMDNILRGENNQFNLYDVEETTNPITQFGIDGFVPKTMQDFILKKTLELTVGNEGNYTTAKNDTNASTGKKISPSIGIMQWRGNNARTLFERIYNEIPNNADAKYYARSVNWNNSAPWSASEQQRLESFLINNLAVVKKVQDNFAVEYVRNTNLNPVYTHAVNTGKIKDPRAIVYLADFANTGPAHVKSFMSNYTSTADMGPREFDGFIQQFKSKSYWGGKSIYQNRMNNLYNSLVGWSPEGGNGNVSLPAQKPITPLSIMEGGNGDEITVSNNSTEFDKQRSGGFGENYPDISEDIENLKILSRVIPRDTRRVDEMNITKLNNNNRLTDLTPELLEKAVNVLEKIAVNTETSNRTLKDIHDREIELPIGNDNPSNNQVNVEMNNNVRQGGNGLNPMMNFISQRKNNKEVNNYNKAVATAAGRFV